MKAGTSGVAMPCHHVDLPPAKTYLVSMDASAQRRWCVSAGSMACVPDSCASRVGILRRFGLGAARRSAHSSMDMGGISLLGQQGVQGGRDGSNEYCLLVSQNAELS